jgi:hypothetical protein
MTDPKKGAVRHTLDVVMTVEHGIHTIRFYASTMPHLDVAIERNCWPGASKPHNRRRKPKRKAGK